MSCSIHQQLHGYRSGHQLLQSSGRLNRKDQDLIDHLSDMAGPLRPGERFDPYLSAYPLPSLEYFALAWTEQDLHAPRAGCVATRTLLVPMHFWGKDASPIALAELLKNPTTNDPVVASSKPEVETLAPIENPVLAELVEALFLEQRRAIVVFEARNSNEIALRLLTALWAGMRRRFSLCTFALSPRSLPGKSFDLLFSPKSARTRFSNWDGRRIEAAGKPIVKRHRWTSRIAQRIFASRIPHLLDGDSVSGLEADVDEESEYVLRLFYLWEELLEKAIKSPTAVLGLVDIARSRDAVASTWMVLEPAIEQAVTDAAESMDTKSAWNFLTALLGKFGNESLTGPIGESLYSAGTKLTQRDWGSALSYLSSDMAIRKGNCRYLFESVARVLATVDADQLTEALVCVSPERLVKIVLLDDQLLARVFSAPDAAIDAALIQSLTEGLKSLTAEESSDQRIKLLSCIRGDQDSALLAQIIAGAESARLVEAVELVWGARGLRTSRLGKVFCDAAMAGDSKLRVRTAFACLDDDVRTNQCIEWLIEADPIDMEWLVENSVIRKRRTMFLAGFIKRANSEELEQALRTPEVATKALKLLTSELRRNASTAARVVVLPTIAAPDHVTLGLKIYPMLQGAERKKLAQSLAIRVMTDATVQSGDQLERVMAAVVNDLDLQSVITIGLDTEQDGVQVSRILNEFDRIATKERTLIGAHVDQIVRLVVSRGDFDLTVDGAMAIARFIERATELDRDAYMKICSSVLRFGIAAVHKPASPIIIAAFPVIYDELRKGKDVVGVKSIFTFVDWDKCKIARKDLVRAFMVSDWPPVDLAITAIRAGELRKILKLLLKEPEGSVYLTKVQEGAQNLEDDIRKPVLKALMAVGTIRFSSVNSDSQ